MSDTQARVVDLEPLKFIEKGVVVSGLLGRRTEHNSIWGKQYEGLRNQLWKEVVASSVKLPSL